MSIPAVQPLSFGLIDALDRLGLKTRDLPGVQEGPLLPVLIVADISKSLSSELVEARRLATVALAPAPGNFQGYVLQAMTGGGIVVEDVQVQIDAGSPFPPFCRIQVLLPPAFAGPGPGSFTDIGGKPAIGFPLFFVQVAPLISVFTGCGHILCQTPVVGTMFKGSAPARIYVPPGHVLILQTDGVNTAFGAQVVWRELEDIQGGP